MKWNSNLNDIGFKLAFKHVDIKKKKCLTKMKWKTIYFNTGEVEYTASHIIYDINYITIVFYQYLLWW